MDKKSVPTLDHNDTPFMEAVVGGLVFCDEEEDKDSAPSVTGSTKIFIIEDYYDQFPLKKETSSGTNKEKESRETTSVEKRNDLKMEEGKIKSKILKKIKTVDVPRDTAGTKILHRRTSSSKAASSKMHKETLKRKTGNAREGSSGSPIAKVRSVGVGKKFISNEDISSDDSDWVNIVPSAEEHNENKKKNSSAAEKLSATDESYEKEHDDPLDFIYLLSDTDEGDEKNQQESSSAETESDVFEEDNSNSSMNLQEKGGKIHKYSKKIFGRAAAAKEDSSSVNKKKMKVNDESNSLDSTHTLFDREEQRNNLSECSFGVRKKELEELKVKIPLQLVPNLIDNSSIGNPDKVFLNVHKKNLHEGVNSDSADTAELLSDPEESENKRKKTLGSSSSIEVLTDEDEDKRKKNERVGKKSV